MNTIAAVIFDMDGVILDTENLVRRCWRALGPQYHMPDADALYIAQTGTTHAYLEQLLRTRCGADFPVGAFLADISKRFHAIEAADGIPVKPGAPETLRALSQCGLRIGLASSTRQPIVEQELMRAGLLNAFDYVLGGDRIAHSKPAPDIYLAACRALDVPPSRAVAVEDSYNGIRAAAAAGMIAVMVPDQLPPTHEMHTLCRAVLPSLHPLTDCIAQWNVQPNL